MKEFTKDIAMNSVNLYKYTTFSPHTLEKEFSTSLQDGLFQAEVLKRQRIYGLNTIEQKSPSWYRVFFRQINTSFTYLLALAGIISFAVHDATNGSIILLTIAINSFLGFFQEYKAEQSLRLLRRHLISKVTVLRNGIFISVESTELVPGDILHLAAGDRIPADVRFLTATSLTVNESSLTGESVPVQKIASPLPASAQTVYEGTNIGFLGTLVTSGSSTALVITTGSQTVFGSISTLSLTAQHTSTFQTDLAKLSTFLLVTALITIIALFVSHFLLKGMHTDWAQLLLFALALTVGLAPEALPTVTTFALSQGALQLAHHNVVVRRLSSIEDLGAINLLCTDKTGTLTENTLTVTELYPVNRAPLLLHALLASKKEHVTEPFDQALWAAATDSDKEQENHYIRIKEVPFDPHKRRNVVLVKNDDYLLIVRGAYEELITHTQPFKEQEALEKWIQSQAQQGNRSIALAYKHLSTLAEDIEKELCDLTFAGVIAFNDPIKSSAMHAVTQAQRFGIIIKMLTGDSKEVACAVAQHIGLTTTPECALTGATFEGLSSAQQEQAVKDYTVFARVTPEQKYRIVSLLCRYNTVGFLGEGINDAPALKSSHVALVVQHASDLAKENADIVLLKKSLNVIIEGIILGRQIFSNTTKYLLATLSSNFGNSYSIAIASLFVPFLPMLPLQILLVNLLSDFPMISIATDTVEPKEVKKPTAFNLKTLTFMMIVLGLISSIFDFIIFGLFYRQGALVLQTNWFIASILTELVLIFSIRTKQPFYKATAPSRTLMLSSVIAFILTLIIPLTSWGQQVFHLHAPTKTEYFIIISIVCSYFIITELAKLFYYRLKNHS